MQYAKTCMRVLLVQPEEISSVVDRKDAYFAGENDLFIVEMEPQDIRVDVLTYYGSFKEVSINTVVPIEIADSDLSPEFVLNWVQTYGIPMKLYKESNFSLFNEDGQSEYIHNLVPLKYMQQAFLEVREAVNLWRWIAEEEYNKIRDFLHISRDNIYWLRDPYFGVLGNCELPPYWERRKEKENDDEFKNDESAALLCALTAFVAIVNNGLMEFNYIPQKGIDIFYVNPELSHDEVLELNYGEVPKLKPPKLKHVSMASDIMAHIWSVIDQKTDEKKIYEWPYKCCIDCKKWEDISLHGRRSSWNRCDICTIKHDRERNTTNQRKRRDNIREDEIKKLLEESNKNE